MCAINYSTVVIKYLNETESLTVLQVICKMKVMLMPYSTVIYLSLKNLLFQAETFPENLIAKNYVCQATSLVLVKQIWIYSVKL